MILDALHFLRDQINATTPADGPKVELGNIARINDGDDFTDSLTNKILLSVINIEEDTVVRHVAHFERADNQIRFRNPPVYLNLSVMFAATHTDYDSALIALEAVLLFFQRNRFFSAESSEALEDYNELHDVQIEKITFELVNLGLEQLHQLWSGLGGHYMPSVIYLMRMLQIDARQTTSGEPIREIKIESWHQKQKS